VPAGEPTLRLASVDLLDLDEPTTHVARFLPSLTCAAAAPEPSIACACLKAPLCISALAALATMCRALTLRQRAARPHPGAPFAPGCAPGVAP
jgi:hypothetical protein